MAGANQEGQGGRVSDLEMTREKLLQEFELVRQYQVLTAGGTEGGRQDNGWRDGTYHQTEG